MSPRRLLGRLVQLALLALLLAWLWPYLKNAVRFVQLLREEPPQALPVPVEGVSARRLADTWGAARSGGRKHQGIDIFAPRGTPVRAATYGVVTRRGWNELGGRVMTVMGPGGQHHYYAHLEAFAGPGLGDWVEEGDVLGFVGDSGNAKGTPPHLHYGIYGMAGVATNPYPLLTATADVRFTPPARPRP